MQGGEIEWTNLRSDLLQSLDEEIGFERDLIQRKRENESWKIYNQNYLNCKQVVQKMDKTANG